MKKYIIPEWRRAWRMATVRIGLLGVAWGGLTVDVQSSILQLVGVPIERVPAVIGIAVIVFRLLKQPKVSGDQQP